MDLPTIERLVKGNYYEPCNAGCDTAGITPQDRHRLEYFCIQCGEILCKVAKERDDPEHRHLRVYMIQLAPAVRASDVEDILDVERIYRYDIVTYVQLRSKPFFRVVKIDGYQDACLKCGRMLYKKKTARATASTRLASPASSSTTTSDDSEDDAPFRNFRAPLKSDKWCSVACRYEIHWRDSIGDSTY